MGELGDLVLEPFDLREGLVELIQDLLDFFLVLVSLRVLFCRSPEPPETKLIPSPTFLVLKSLTSSKVMPSGYATQASDL